MLNKFMIVALAVLVIASFALVPNSTSAAGSGTNPPPNYGTIIVDEPVGVFPSTLDPANCYDTASAECIFNSMETVIFFLGEQYSMFMPQLATQVTVAPRDLASPAYTNFTVYFKIRGVNPATGAGSIPFHNRCRTDDGTVPFWGNFFVNTTDVEYSWERFLIHDYIGGPTWIWYKPLLDCQAANTGDPDWGNKINNAVQKNSTHVWINVCNPGLATTPTQTFAPVNMFLTDGGTFDPNFYNNAANLPLDYPLRILMQVVSQYWCSITSKQWVLNYVNTHLPGIGGGLPAEWDGTPANWASYTGWATSPFDELPTTAATPGVMCGTGPYILESYAAATGWSSLIHTSYWRGWPAADFSPPYPNVDPTIVPSHIQPAGYLKRIRVQQRSTAVSMMDLMSGAADMAYVARADAGQLHRNGDRNAETLAGIRLNYPLGTMAVECLHYTFEVDNPGGANTYGIIYPDDTLNPAGIPANFFSNAHVRKAMTYLVDYTYNIVNLYNKEGYQPRTCAPNYLPYVNPSNPMYGPQANYAAAKKELDLAMFGGVWLNTTGFNVTICYCDTAGDARKISCVDLASNINLIGTLYSLPYTAVTQGVPWNSFSTGIIDHLFAVFRAAWMADYADIHDYLFPFANSQGFFGSAQRFSDPAIDADLAQAARTPDGSMRQALYYDAEMRLYNDNPTVFILVPFGRGYSREWVQGAGVEYNLLYPGVYARYLWKWLYMRGNVDYDKFCNMGDLNNILDAFGSYIYDARITSKWNLHSDVDGNPKDAWDGANVVRDGGWRDRKIDMYDIVACIDNLFKTEPAPYWQPYLTGW